MKNLNKTLIAAGIMAAAAPASAEYLYGFGNMYIDQQMWDHQYTSNNPGTDVRNKTVLGLDGGAGFTWGELYGFYEFEGLGKDSKDFSSSLKGTGHIYLGESNVSLYGQFYNTLSSGFHEQNQVLGLGYTGLTGNGWWFKPFIGVHNAITTDRDSSGLNGYMAGWSAGYNFNLGAASFTLVNWNEIEFARNEAYSAANGGDNGLNGSLLLFWNITENWKAAVQYRYSQNKLGVTDANGSLNTYNDFAIYRIQYSF